MEVNGRPRSFATARFSLTVTLNIKINNIETDITINIERLSLILYLFEAHLTNVYINCREGGF